MRANSITFVRFRTVLLATVHTGGVGLNIVEANRVVFCDRRARPQHAHSGSRAQHGHVYLCRVLGFALVLALVLALVFVLVLRVFVRVECVRALRWCSANALFVHSVRAGGPTRASTSRRSTARTASARRRLSRCTTSTRVRHAAFAGHAPRPPPPALPPRSPSQPLARPSSVAPRSASAARACAAGDTYDECVRETMAAKSAGARLVLSDGITLIRSAETLAQVPRAALDATM
eukprot:4032198-Prymnesium_polylepis.1